MSVKNLEYEKIKSENDALKKELTSLREAYNPDRLQHESKQFKVLYKAEKEQSRNAKKKVAKLREEVLNVKKEKRESLVVDQETQIHKLGREN